MPWIMKDVSIKQGIFTVYCITHSIHKANTPFKSCIRRHWFWLHMFENKFCNLEAEVTKTPSHTPVNQNYVLLVFIIFYFFPKPVATWSKRWLSPQELPAQHWPCKALEVQSLSQSWSLKQQHTTLGSVVLVGSTTWTKVRDVQKATNISLPL